MTSDALTTPTHGTVPKGGGRRSGAPAIEKGAAVLGALSSRDEPMTLAELTHETGLARSSLHDVCSSLVHTGLAEKTPENTYTIGLRLVTLAHRRLNSMEIVSTFQTVCRAMDSCSETIVLSVLSGTDVIYLSFVPGSKPLAVRYEVGMRLPAHRTASGKAMLATLPDARILADFGELRHATGVAEAETPSAETLIVDLKHTRERGYSIDDEETAPGMACVGAPVFVAGIREVAGAVAISMVKSKEDWLDARIVDYVRTVAAEVSRQLGGAPT